MKLHICRLALVAAAALTLAACASTTPTQFYTLIPTASPNLAASDSTFQIAVLPVDIPEQVDRSQLVVREGNGGIVPVETRQWIAPLASEIRGALSADLTSRLGAQDVYGIAAAPGQTTYTIRLKVLRFDSALGTYARIDALWTIHTDKNGSATCSSSANINVASGYEELALGHQRALAQIANDIATSIRNARQGNAVPVCPANAAR